MENSTKLESFGNLRNGGDVPLQFDFTRIMRKSTKKNVTLEELGYEYKRIGEKTLLRAIYNENWGFKWRGQKHYNALSKAMLKEVKRRMLEQGLSEETRSDRTTILKSKDVETADQVLVLIQGSGKVRPGTWANSVCINHDLESGAMMTAVARARKNGWGVLVLDPNSARDCINHTVDSWDSYISNSKAASNGQVLVIAHSNGGRCVMGLLKNREESVLRECKRIAFTDAVHWKVRTLSKDAKSFLKSNSIDWVASEKPLDTPLKYACQEEDMKKALKKYCTPYRGFGVGDPIPIRSAGHTEHVWTTGKALNSVFDYLESK